MLRRDDVQELSRKDRGKSSNNNPVLETRCFQFRVEICKEIILDGPLGKRKYHAIRVEIQV